jgi:hypothetical protein
MRVVARSVFLSSVLGACVAILSAEAPDQQAGGQIVVRAMTNDGRPVLDLTAGDVTVRVDGRQREIKALDLVRPVPTAASATAAPAPAPAPALPAPYSTNIAAAASGATREFLVAIDDEGIAPGRDAVVKEAVQTLVSRLSPSDAVGVVSMRRGGLSLAPTIDRAAASEMLGKIVAAGSPTESVNDFGCRTKAVLVGLSSLLQGAPAKRTILLFSSGVTPPTGDQIRESLGKQKDADEAVCQVRQRELDDLGRAASGSAAAVVVVFVPEAVANTAHLRNGEIGLENVAGVTNGEMVRMIGAAGDAMTKIAETSGIYYLATVEGELGTDVRRVEARVSRDGLRVAARPLSAAAPAAVKAGSPRDMIRVATVYRELPLRAAGFVSRQPGANDLKVVALFEPDDPTIQITSAVVGLFDEKETLKAQWTAQANELGRAPLVGALVAPPGKYRMRVAATDSAGKAGTADYALTVGLPDAAPLKTSHMLLGVGQNGFAPKLAFTSADAAAIGFIELYNVAKDAKVDVTFEILKPGGEALGSGQGTVAPGNGEDARIAYGGFGIATLEPGDYTMRATINVDGKQAGVAERTLRKLK